MTDKIPATCDLCDAHRADTDGAFRVLPPLFRDFGARHAFHGPVSTIKCFEDNSLVKAAVESPGEGRVLGVFSGLGDDACDDAFDWSETWSPAAA